MIRPNIKTNHYGSELTFSLFFFLNISSHTYINTKFILNIFQVTEEALRLASTQQTNTTKVATIHLQKLEAQVTGLFTF